MNRPAVGVLAAALLASATPVAADVYKLKTPDGTVHFTNAPNDPRYQRLGFKSGTAAGWLRLPRGETAPYRKEIVTAAERYGGPERLVSAVIRAESGFNPTAVSRKGARGLMQLMPSTAAMLGVRDSFDPRQNIDGGVRHLRTLMDRFSQNLPLAVAAYNAGESAVLAHGGIPPYPETREYVRRVLRLYGAGSDGDAPRSRVYQVISQDGHVTYTNIPPRGRP